KEITETQPKNPSTVSLHHRRKEWHTAAVGRTQSSPSVRLSSFPRAPTLQPLFAVTDRSCFLASAAVCLPSSSFAFFGVHRSRSLAVHRSSSHSRSSGSHVALLQTLRPTRALHLAVELLSFVAL
ncbi:hypothetical protein S245_023754, partial [Arachis hypogaea]